MVKGEGDGGVKGVVVVGVKRWSQGCGGAWGSRDEVVGVGSGRVKGWDGGCLWVVEV